MTKMSVKEFKSKFPEVLKQVIAGEEIAILYGRKKEIVARLVPQNSVKKPKRKLGILEGKGKIKFGKDFKMTDEEFLIT